MTPAYGERFDARTEIARRRQEADLSQEELARITGISIATLQRLEAGDARNPGIVTMVALAGALQCTVDELVQDRWVKDAFVKGLWETDPRISEAARARRTAARLRHR